ncbi:hypothetical protein [Halogeometricum sp. CBA1124]|uniref:hypothetical protein n=1 Tax=Halogeometricum sp. CBA1124 TaxID=2668071 RepID=UPI001E2E6745|nr:hypothetical protein [Halogeometricum sp. CBA1124]
MRPTRNGEMPRMGPSVGSVGKATPAPTPPKNTPAMRLPATKRTLGSSPPNHRLTSRPLGVSRSGETERSRQSPAGFSWTPS